ncbi:unnamed protein product [Chrysoparadoxa australica]
MRRSVGGTPREVEVEGQGEEVEAAEEEDQPADARAASKLLARNLGNKLSPLSDNDDENAQEAQAEEDEGEGPETGTKEHDDAVEKKDDKEETETETLLVAVYDAKDLTKKKRIMSKKTAAQSLTIKVIATGVGGAGAAEDTPTPPHAVTTPIDSKEAHCWFKQTLELTVPASQGSSGEGTLVVEARSGEEVIGSGEVELSDLIEASRGPDGSRWIKLHQRGKGRGQVRVSCMPAASTATAAVAAEEELPAMQEGVAAGDEGVLEGSSSGEGSDAMHEEGGSEHEEGEGTEGGDGRSQSQAQVQSDPSKLRRLLSRQSQSGSHHDALGQGSQYDIEKVLKSQTSMASVSEEPAPARPEMGELPRRVSHDEGTRTPRAREGMKESGISSGQAVASAAPLELEAQEELRRVTSAVGDGPAGQAKEDEVEDKEVEEKAEEEALEKERERELAAARQKLLRKEKLKELAQRRQRNGPQGRVRAGPSGSGREGKDEMAAVRIQGAWRGKRERVHQRRRRRAAVCLQALARGHSLRKAAPAILARAKRAAWDERRTQQRRRRVARAQLELHMLESTPAASLLRIDAVRRAHCARVIQRWWLRRHGVSWVTCRQSSCKGKKALMDQTRWKEAARGVAAATAGLKAPPLPSQTATVRCSSTAQRRTGQARPASLRLADLQERVMLASKAKERRCRGEAKLLGATTARYASLLEQQQRAQVLLEERAELEARGERAQATLRRAARLQKFRRLQDLLLSPPGLNEAGELAPPTAAAGSDTGASREDAQAESNDEASAGEEGSEVAEEEEEKVELPEPDAAGHHSSQRSWQLPHNKVARRRAENAHRSTLAALKGERWWASRVPEDPQAAPADLRSIKMPVPFPLRESRQHMLPLQDQGSHAHVTDNEASMWWYGYAVKGTPHANRCDGTSAKLYARVQQGPHAVRLSAEQQVDEAYDLVQRSAERLVQEVLYKQKGASINTYGASLREHQAAKVESSACLFPNNLPGQRPRVSTQVVDWRREQLEVLALNP